MGDEYGKDRNSLTWLFLENSITNVMIYEEHKGQYAFTSVILRDFGFWRHRLRTSNGAPPLDPAGPLNLLNFVPPTSDSWRRHCLGVNVMDSAPFIWEPMFQIW